jgi:hypothetical protein
LISPLDASIIAVICKYPDMSDEELHRYMDRLENPANKNLCLALLGRINPDTLDENAQQELEEIKGWHLSGVLRRRNEQINARHNNRETQMSQKMISMRERGLISEETLILYGISGPIPERHPTRDREYTHEEKLAELHGRMERRFGIRWRERFSRLPAWLAIEDPSWFSQHNLGKVNWMKEGF